MARDLAPRAPVRADINAQLRLSKAIFPGRVRNQGRNGFLGFAHRFKAVYVRNVRLVEWSRSWMSRSSGSVSV